MARKIVTVDEFLRLPSDVSAALKADLDEEFTLAVQAAQEAATSSQSAAVEAQAAASEATASTEEAVQDAIVSMGFPARQASGVSAVTVSSGATGAQAVTFPPSHFSQTPVVLATTDNPNFVVAVQDRSASGMSIRVQHRAGSSSTVTVNVMWLALDMSAVVPPE